MSIKDQIRTESARSRDLKKVVSSTKDPWWEQGKLSKLKCQLRILHLTRGYLKGLTASQMQSPNSSKRLELGDLLTSLLENGASLEFAQECTRDFDTWYSTLPSQQLGEH